MPTPLSRFLFRERVLIILVASLGIVAWRHWGMNRSIALVPGSYRVEARNDHPDGGTSVCSVDIHEGRWKLSYDIRPGVSWAFCGMNIDLSDPATGRGMDLSGYDTIVFFLEPMTGPNDLLQIQLLSMDSTVYRPEDPMTIKFLTMDLIPSSRDSRRSALPLSFFSVPGWWAARHHIPSKHLDPVRYDVRSIEALTSNGTITYGSGTVEIDRIELRGKWIRQETLFKWLLAACVFYSLTFLFLRLLRALRRESELCREATQLHELVGKDPLTAILNRRGFESAFDALRADTSIGEKEMLGVAMLDLDHFKQINDTQGHAVGDDVLRQVARLLRAQLRAGNICCRYGGEEFLVAIAGISTERLMLLAEQIRTAIEESVVCEGRRVTASVGIAHGTIAEMHTLVKRADDALYRAKRNGRNRVEADV